VMSTSGKGTTTDSNGNYAIQVYDDDSISFSYLGRTTQKFPINGINRFTGFDIALHVNPTELNEVRVAPRNYHLDSLRNRQEYAKVFDYKKPSFAITSPGQGGLGVGVDLDAIISMFNFKKTRRMLAFQRRLEDEEQNAFIDHRFNRSLVKKLTHLDNDELDTFMLKYRPSYEFCKTANDYVFYDYIKLASKEFTRLKIKNFDAKKEQ